VLTGVVALTDQNRRGFFRVSRSHRALSGFAVWLLVGFLTTGAVLTLGSIGLVLLPLAVIAVFVAVRRFSFGTSTIGAVAGLGLAFVCIGIVNLGTQSCPSGPFVLGPGQLGSLECGGANPTPWLVAGAALVLAAVGVDVVLERYASHGTRHHRQQQGPNTSH
jgi:hypothetical protein